MHQMPEKLTFWPSPILFWLMVVVTTAAIAGMIYMAAQWERDDHRMNEWFDQMCAVHGGAYCEHELPPVTPTGTP
jgi:hypothetical protein